MGERYYVTTSRRWASALLKTPPGRAQDGLPSGGGRCYWAFLLVIRSSLSCSRQIWALVQASTGPPSTAASANGPTSYCISPRTTLVSSCSSATELKISSNVRARVTNLFAFARERSIAIFLHTVHKLPLIAEVRDLSSTLSPSYG